MLLIIAGASIITRRTKANRLRAAEIKVARLRALRKTSVPFVSASLRGNTTQERPKLKSASLTRLGLSPPASGAALGRPYACLNVCSLKQCSQTRYVCPLSILNQIARDSFEQARQVPRSSFSARICAASVRPQAQTTTFLGGTSKQGHYRPSDCRM